MRWSSVRWIYDKHRGVVIDGAGQSNTPYQQVTWIVWPKGRLCSPNYCLGLHWYGSYAESVWNGPKSNAVYVDCTLETVQGLTSHSQESGLPFMNAYSTPDLPPVDWAAFRAIGRGVAVHRDPTILFGWWEDHTEGPWQLLLSERPSDFFTLFSPVPLAIPEK